MWGRTIEFRTMVSPGTATPSPEGGEEREGRGGQRRVGRREKGGEKREGRGEERREGRREKGEGGGRGGEERRGKGEGRGEGRGGEGGGE